MSKAMFFFRPTIVKIKTECEKEFAKYERCMNANPVNTHYCLEDFTTFNSCAEQYIPPSGKVFLCWFGYVDCLLTTVLNN